MDSIQEVINELFRMKKEYSTPQGCCVQTEQQNRHRLKCLNIAISALEEELKKEYGCDACWEDADNEPEYIGTGLDEYGQECKYLILKDQHLMINYCPMCGRKLTSTTSSANI